MIQTLERRCCYQALSRKCGLFTRLHRWSYFIEEHKNVHKRDPEQVWGRFQVWRDLKDEDANVVMNQTTEGTYCEPEYKNIGEKSRGNWIYLALLLVEHHVMYYVLSFSLWIDIFPWVSFHMNKSTYKVHQQEILTSVQLGSTEIM